MFKKRSRKGHARSRPPAAAAAAAAHDDDNDDDDDHVAVIEAAKKHKLDSSTQSRSQRRSNPLLHSTHRRHTDLEVTISSASSRSAAPAGPADQGAAMLIPKNDDKEDNEDEVADEEPNGGGKTLYTGMKAYDKKKKQSQKSVFGPIRAPANVRISCRFDYQPDVCKDYKETGYCGYGDSCKFLHDRGDYKSGWHLEKEWEQQQAKKKQRMLGEHVDEDENYEIESDEELPFACFICREEFVRPVVTKCGHYFCEDCALQRHAKNTRCATCQEQTFGIFNTATKMLERIKRKADLKRSAEESDDECS